MTVASMIRPSAIAVPTMVTTSQAADSAQTAAVSFCHAAVALPRVSLRTTASSAVAFRSTMSRICGHQASSYAVIIVGAAAVGVVVAVVVGDDVVRGKVEVAAWRTGDMAARGRQRRCSAA